jgi:hypothetical protein
MKLLRIGDDEWVNLDLVTNVVIASPHAVKFYHPGTGPDGEINWSAATGQWADKVILWLAKQRDPTGTNGGLR